MSTFLNGRRNLNIMLLVLVMYLAFLTVTNSLSSFHLAFVGAAIFLFMTHYQTRLFLLLALPFGIQNVSWDLLRFVPFSYLQPINVVGPYTWEIALFGVRDGSVLVPPAMWFSHLNIPIVEYITSFFYSISDPMIPIMGLFFWKVVSVDHCKKFMVAFLVMNVFAFLTYVYFPVAAPWYVIDYGLYPPVAQILGSAAGLVDLEGLLGISSFTTSYQMNPVVFGAIPSMHAGFAAISLIYSIATRRSWLIAVMTVYTLIMLFSAVWLTHHYIIDLMIGLGYAVLGYVITEGFLVGALNRFYYWVFRLFFFRNINPIFPVQEEKLAYLERLLEPPASAPATVAQE